MQLEDLKKLATLARMEVSDVELERVGKDFTSILDYVGQIKDATTEEITTIPLVKNVAREDDESIMNEKGRTLIKAAKESTEEFVKVPKVIE